jgi:excisionase family DNA binding protein
VQKLAIENGRSQIIFFGVFLSKVFHTWVDFFRIRHLLDLKYYRMDSPMIFQYSRDEFKSLLKEALREIMAERKDDTTNESTLINVQEAAALLNLAVNTLYEKTSEKLIPHYKHGKKIMFKKSELLAWVEARKVKTIQELRKDAASLTLSRSRR